jgi:hypothetical protein
MLTYADRYLHDARGAVGGNAKVSSAAPSPRARDRERDRERERQQSPRAANRSSAPSPVPHAGVRAGVRDGVRAGGESPLPRQASNLRSPRSVQAHTAAAKGGAQVHSLLVQKNNY